jgi:hypothetical protein
VFSCAVFFLWGKGLNAEGTHKEMFLLHGGKCLSRKAIHDWAQKFSPRRSKVSDDTRQGAEVAEITVKALVRRCVSVLVEVTSRNKYIFFFKV